MSEPTRISVRELLANRDKWQARAEAAEARLAAVTEALRYVVATTNGSHDTMASHDHSLCVPWALDLARAALSAAPPESGRTGFIVAAGKGRAFEVAVIRDWLAGQINPETDAPLPPERRLSRPLPRRQVVAVVQTLLATLDAARADSLDVGRLARAMHVDAGPRWEIDDMRLYRAKARRVAAEYARLASPETEPR